MRIQRTVIQEENEEQIASIIDLSLLDEALAHYKSKKGNVIPLLQAAQESYRYIPASAFEKISSEAGIPLSQLYGVATFYAQFRLNPVGKHIVKVCHGTACHVQNAAAISTALEEYLKINDGQTTPDELFTIESVACLGCCSLAPVMMIGDETYGSLTGKSSVSVVRDI